MHYNDKIIYNTHTGGTQSSTLQLLNKLFKIHYNGKIIYNTHTGGTQSSILEQLINL